MIGPSITSATQDDWVFVFQMRRPITGAEYTRTVGVNGWVPFARAMRLAETTVRPPRATKEGRSHDIIDARWIRFHEWQQGKEPVKYDVHDTVAM